MRNSELKPRQFNEALYGFDDIKDYTKTAKDIGINTLGDLQRFKKEAPIEGVASESDMEELKKYKDKLGQNFEIKNEEFNLDEALGIAEQLKESTKSDSDLEKLIDDATGEYFTNVDPYAFNNNPFDTDRELMSSFKNDLHNIRYVRELIKEYSGVKEHTKFVEILYQIESELLPPKPSYLGDEDDYDVYNEEDGHNNTNKGIELRNQTNKLEEEHNTNEINYNYLLSNAEKQEIDDFNRKHHWSIYDDELVDFANKWNNITDKEKAKILYRLTDCNFHHEAELLRQNKPEELLSELGVTNESLKEEYGPHKYEPYCEEIADRLEDGFWSDDTQNGTPWELTINGLSRSEFKPSFADYLAEEVAYPVRDGHLSYRNIEMVLSRDTLESIFGYDTLDKIVPDLVKLGVDREEIDEWLKSEDSTELDIWYDYDIAFDSDEWERKDVETNLPSEVEVSIYDVDYVEGETDPEELSDTLSDYLSDTYGYTHFGFDFDVKGDTIYVYNIRWDLDEKLNENIIKITSKNLKDFYLKPTGNIYYKDPDMKSFEVVDDFSEQDILNAMQNGVVFVYKEGPVSNFIDEKLIQSSSKDALQKNIKTEIKAGKDPKQATAIAYSVKEKNEDLTQDMLNDLEDRDINFEKDKEAERQAKVELAKNGVETDPLNEDDDFGSTDGWNI